MEVIRETVPLFIEGRVQRAERTERREFQAELKNGARSIPQVKDVSLRATLVTPSAPRCSARPSINRGTVCRPSRVHTSRMAGASEAMHQSL